MAVTAKKITPRFKTSTFLSQPGPGRTLASYVAGKLVFVQGDEADAVFYIQKGKIKVSVISKSGKEAVIAILGPGDFFGEGCLAAQPIRISNATALSAVTVMRINRSTVVAALHKESAFSEMLLSYMLSRTIRIEEDLVDQLFNSSEKRLARALLLLANFGKPGSPEKMIPKISQETLAEMVGTTRSRVSFFMNKFRKLGFIKYNGHLYNGHLEIHSSLLNVVLHD